MQTNQLISHRLKEEIWCLKSLGSWSKFSYSLIKLHQKQAFKQICLNTSWLVTMSLDFKFLSRETMELSKLLLATELSISIISCQWREEQGTHLICLCKRLWPSHLSWLSSLLSQISHSVELKVELGLIPPNIQKLRLKESQGNILWSLLKKASSVRNLMFWVQIWEQTSR